MSANADNKDSASPNALERGDAPIATPTSPVADATQQPDSGLRNRKEPLPTSYPPSSPVSPAVRTGTQRTGTTALNSPLDASALTEERKHSKRKLSYWQALLKPKKKVGSTPTWSSSLRAIVFASWLNILLVFIPVSWALHFAIDNDTVIFVTAFLAIIPLASLLGFATEELSLRVGETLGGLLNATLGNAVELIISIIALTKCQLRVVQASLIGSILSNLLLVLGMCFFAGGTKFATQGFLLSAAQLNSSLLTLSVVAVLIPATFHAALTTSGDQTNEGTITTDSEGDRILKMSRGVSIILLFIYGCNLAYQLWSHAHLYESKEAGGVQKSVKYPDSVRLPHWNGSKRSLKGSTEALNGVTAASNVLAGVTASTTGPVDGEAAGRPSMSESHHTGPQHVAVSSDGHLLASIPEPEAEGEDDGEEVEEPQISVIAATVLLIVVTVLVAFTAEFLVDSINGLVDNSPLSQEWVGLILLPIVGNAAEHVTAVTVSVKDKLDLSIGVAVGSSIQISLLVIPFMVVLGWIIGKPLTLLFDPFEAVVLFLTVITVNYVVADGQSNWLEGMILMCLYVVIATALWFYPGNDPASRLLTCS
ncbi:hypothetical protein M407DRAFT_16745 [Tulasnella calospora MUT 4182]|uniref:Sodium/calcium exchanger membrane region domain-containing protein n=1 Tax=Tulasnella calospora MUT 4182 TaxID=1051891 RepID=A0A0C3MM89_9AGAM|nr:hypothetical protein M407DRAFT_16745 [Tulasnella calospora MUT 4182]